jgi:hypothetical protein
MLALALAGLGPGAPSKKEEGMTEESRRVLANSRDSRALVGAALSLARSQQQQDHADLVRWLASGESLRRLDSEADYSEIGRRIRIERVLGALIDNRVASARAAIVALTESAEFIAEPRRVDMLIRATAVVRPAPPSLVAFWNRFSQPDDGYTPLTIRAVLDNGSPPAITVFEQKMVDPQHEEDDKVEWLRSGVVAHRDDLPLLEGCERLLRGRRLSPPLEDHLIDVLFDYRPDEWYSEARVFVPPDRARASAESRAALRRIAELAVRSLPLTERQRKAIEVATSVRAEPAGR